MNIERLLMTAIWYAEYMQEILMLLFINWCAWKCFDMKRKKKNP